MSSIIVKLCLVLSILCCCFRYSAQLTNTKLVIVSMDGFRASYFSQQNTPHLFNLARFGVLAKGMVSIFPSKTFPNHWSIATGSYAESHGVSGNGAYDPIAGKFIPYGFELFHFNDQIVPIWRWNEMLGGMSGIHMWTGCEYRYQGYTPQLYMALNKTISMKQRVDNVVSYLRKGANLAMLYLNQPDKDGHAYSPASRRVRSTVRSVDEVILYLQQSIYNDYRLRGITNIIVLSDHGMMSVRLKNVIDLYRFMDRAYCKFHGSSPVVQVSCSHGKTMEACRNLTYAGDSLKTFNAYTDQQLPRHFHVRNYRRFGPCSVVAEPKYAFGDLLRAGFVTRKNPRSRMDAKFGVHGYDPSKLRMRPFFAAQGPSFRNGTIVTNSFENIDLYHLFCRLLELKTRQIDGINRVDVWNQMLVN